MTLLASMPITVGRVNLVNARTQGNLKADVSDKKNSSSRKREQVKRGVHMDHAKGMILAQKW